MAHLKNEFPRLKANFKLHKTQKAGHFRAEFLELAEFMRSSASSCHARTDPTEFNIEKEPVPIKVHIPVTVPLHMEKLVKNRDHAQHIERLVIGCL